MLSTANETKYFVLTWEIISDTGNQEVRKRSTITDPVN